MVVSEQIGLAAISYDVHKGKPEDVDLDSVCLQDMHRYTLYVAPPQGSRCYVSFNHLAGYSSTVYTYMWDKVIAEDFFLQFDQKNLFAGDVPMRYRHLVLEPGASMPANGLVKNFLGRPHNTNAFQHWVAEEFDASPANPKPNSIGTHSHKLLTFQIMAGP